MSDRPRILIVDDDRSMRRTLEMILNRQGYVVETASTGREGIEKARQGFFNVAFLDIKLPDRQGVDLLTPLQSLHSDIILIVMTGYASVKTAVQALNEGASAYVTKPLDVDEVLTTMEQRLERQRLVEEKRQAERALRELNATLEAKVKARTAEVTAEKEKVETILRSVSDAIVMTDARGRVQYANQALTSLTGYTTEEVIGRPVGGFFEETMAHQLHFSGRSILAEGEPWLGDAKAKRKDGQLYDAAVSIDPVRDREGSIAGYVVRLRDISEEKALERARGRFLTNVSHQFRTPVATLKLQLDLLERSDLSADDRERLKEVQEEVDSLIQLIQGVVDVATLDSGQSGMISDAVLLSGLVENVKNRRQREAEAAGLTLEVKTLPSEPAAVRGDPRWLTRAVDEVVENAVNYTPVGGKITLTVDTITRDGQRWGTIEVQDDGPGIPADEQAKIFDRFFRGTIADSGHTRSVGLGLSIVQAVMRIHGGKVTLESGEEGSTFRLWLPTDAPWPGERSDETADLDGRLEVDDDRLLREPCSDARLEPGG